MERSIKVEPGYENPFAAPPEYQQPQQNFRAPPPIEGPSQYKDRVVRQFQPSNHSQQRFADPRRGYWGRSRTTDQIREERNLPHKANRGIQRQLQKINALQIHQPVRQRETQKRYGKENSKAPLVSVQADLADVHQTARWNKGVRYLLLVVDVYSKYVWVVALTDRTAEKLLKALDVVFKQMGRLPQNFTSDNEFNKTWFSNIYGDRMKLHFTDPGEKFKTGLVERTIRTFRDLIKRYMMHNHSKDYISTLPELVYNYNNTRSSRTDQTPFSLLSGKRSPTVRARMPDNPPDEPFLSKEANAQRKRRGLEDDSDNIVGATVRHIMTRGKFAKGSEPYYSSRVFVVESKVKERYRINDLESGVTYPKLWARHQLLIVEPPKDKTQQRIEDKSVKFEQEQRERLENQPVSSKKQDIIHKNWDAEFIDELDTEHRKRMTQQKLDREGLTQEKLKIAKTRGLTFITDKKGRQVRRSKRLNFIL